MLVALEVDLLEWNRRRKGDAVRMQLFHLSECNPALVIIESTLEETHIEEKRHIQPDMVTSSLPSPAVSPHYLTNKLLSKVLLRRSRYCFPVSSLCLSLSIRALFDAAVDRAQLGEPSPRYVRAERQEIRGF